MQNVLGVDIGGSHITAACVNLSARRILPETLTRISIDSRDAAMDILASWAKVIRDAITKSKTRLTGIGIAVPGPFNHESGVSYMQGNKKYEALYGMDIRHHLALELQCEPDQIRFMNDAASFLQGEILLTFRGEFNRAIGITLGTGLGSAIVAGDRVDDAALWDSKFKDGIAEDYISARWLIKRYYELTGINVLDVKTLSTTHTAGDAAQIVFKEFAENMGAFLVNILPAYQPEVIVLGGNISKASSRFLPALINYLKKQGFSTPVYVSKLQENAAIAGSACLWNSGGFERS